MHERRDLDSPTLRAARIGLLAGILASGAAFAACAESGKVPAGGSSSSSSTGQGGGGEGGAGGAHVACQPGVVEDCDSGPEGTLNVGICKGGSHTCLPSGADFGPCSDEVTPASEDCVTPEDDDCNGVVNDAAAGCMCTPGAVEACYTGDPITKGVGVCKEGSRTCNDKGTGWDACAGEVTPLIEACGNPADEDCDGSACGAPLWSLLFGGSTVDQVGGVAVDSTGNVYVAGSFTGAMMIGGVILVSAGGADVFLAKFDPQGSLLWSQSFGDAAEQGATGVATDAANNVVMTGYFDGTIAFGGSMYTANGRDGFVAKFGDTGAPLWSKKIGVAGNQTGLAIATDASSNVIVTGAFEGQLVCPLGCVVSQGAQDIFVIKYSDQGVQAWSKVFADPADQSPSAVAVDSSNNVLLVGQFKGNAVDFGGGNLLASAGGFDAFVVKLDPAGATTWVKRFGDSLDQQALAVAAGPADSIAIAGSFLSTINLGANDIQSKGLTDAFVATFAADGTHMWERSYGDASEQAAQGVVFDATGGVVLTGGFQGVVDFGGGPLTSLVTYDQYVLRLTDKGAHVWSQRYGDAASQRGKALSRDPVSGHIVIAAAASGSIDYGLGALTSAGGDDVALVKLSP